MGNVPASRRKMVANQMLKLMLQAVTTAWMQVITT
jgi:predicted acetyltransferase